MTDSLQLQLNCSTLPHPSLSWSLLKLMYIESVMPSNYFILCCSFSSWLQSFPASETFPRSRLFTSGGESIEASASASVLLMNIQDCFPLGLTGLISLLSNFAVQGTFKSLLQHHNLKESVIWHSLFIMFSHLYMTTGKTIPLTTQTFVGKVIFF